MRTSETGAMSCFIRLNWPLEIRRTAFINCFNIYKDETAAGYSKPFVL